MARLVRRARVAPVEPSARRRRRRAGPKRRRPETRACVIAPPPPPPPRPADLPPACSVARAKLRQRRAGHPRALLPSPAASPPPIHPSPPLPPLDLRAPGRPSPISSSSPARGRRPPPAAAATARPAGEGREGKATPHLRTTCAPPSPAPPATMHRWLIASCGDMRPSRPARRREEGEAPARRPSAAATAAKLRKVGSEGTLMMAVPKDVAEFRAMTAYGGLTLFTYEDLRRATDWFDAGRIVGEGGFGVVYRGLVDGTLRKGHPPTEVAVKELNKQGLQGDREWLTEVSCLGQYSHPNLVELIGFCCEGDHRLLVYELMARGSLENHLFRRTCRLSWTTRVRIARDVARGLAFLHGADRPIIYRDFKTSNILLDADYNAKLSDFGLAKEGPMGGKTHVSTRVMGTYGYAAPEYIATGHLTVMSDVYGFGVVLLEMVVGRRALEPSRAGAREGSLVDWARPILIRPKKLERIVDRRMGEPAATGPYTPRSLERVARLAYDCLSQNPKVRPAMARVVQTLDAVLAAGAAGAGDDDPAAARPAPAR
ncbi:hypothetical protein ACP4OV_013724 [Aristida adscensionis]